MFLTLLLLLAFDNFHGLMINVHPPEYVGGPTSKMYDSPFVALNVSGTVRGYSANSRSYLIVEGKDVSAVLKDPIYTGLGHGTKKSDLNYCGSWLNTVVHDKHNPNVVHGFYHEEWRCDYARHLYTNKSIAYAVSTDGGRSFTTPEYPNNAIILSPYGNTSTAHQCGEGDQGACIGLDGNIHLWFREWDGPHGRATIGTARATWESGGVPGSWKKWYHGNYAQPARHGESTLLNDIPGTRVDVWKCGTQRTYVSIGAGGPHYPSYKLAVSLDGIHWSQIPSPLWYQQSAEWNRVKPVPELYAYVGLTSDGGQGSINCTTFWVYTTYLKPNGTFSDRYLVRHKVTMDGGDGLITDVLSNSATEYTVSVWLQQYYSPTNVDHWATSGPVVNDGDYGAQQALGGILSYPDPKVPRQTHRMLYDCYIPEWKDHMLSTDKNGTNCPILLRELGYIIVEYPPNQQDATTQTTLGSGQPQLAPLFRCFDKKKKDHYASTNGTACGSQLEFLMGYMYALKGNSE